MGETDRKRIRERETVRQRDREIKVARIPKDH